MQGDAQIAERVRAVARTDVDDRDWDDVLARSELREPRRRTRRRTRLAVGLGVCAALAGAAAPFALLEVHGGASQLPGPRATTQTPSSSSVGVRSLIAYRKPSGATLPADSLPESVTEVLSGLTDATPIAIDEPVVGQAAAGTPSLYLVRVKDLLCPILAIRGATGSCYSTLNRGEGSAALTDAIVDTRRFVYGLTGNDVTAVDVRTPSSPTSHATLAPNVFIARLPARAAGRITVVVTHSDGSHTEFQMPPLPPSPG